MQNYGLCLIKIQYLINNNIWYLETIKNSKKFGVKSNFDVPLIAVHLTLHSFINLFLCYLLEPWSLLLIMLPLLTVTVNQLRRDLTEKNIWLNIPELIVALCLFFQIYKKKIIFRSELFYLKSPKQSPPPRRAKPSWRNQTSQIDLNELIGNETESHVLHIPVVSGNLVDWFTV